MKNSKLLTVLLLGAMSAPAMAQEINEPVALDVQRLDLTLDESSILGVEGAEVQPTGSLTFSMLAGYANDPLVVRDLETDERVGELVGNRYDGALGVAYSLNQNLQIGATLPFVGHQWRDTGSLTGTGDLGEMGIGDLALHTKLYLSQKVLDTALEVGTTLPTGDTDKYVGGDAHTLKTGLAVGKRFGAVRALANVGAVFVSEYQRVNDLQADHELYGRFGLAYRHGRSELGLTYSGAAKLKDPFNRVNRDYGELMGGLTRFYDSGLSPFVGAGVGVNEGYGSPDWRVFAGLHYQVKPKAKKTPPPVVEVPDEPLPPPDTTPPPTPTPEPKVVVIDDLYFKFDRTELTAGGEAMLQELASEVLSVEGAELRLQITGHADSIGRAGYNARLGMRRAEAVAKKLCELGIHKDWVTLVSVGESSPRASNKTVAGRAQNRRVEIKVVSKKGAFEVEERHTPPDGSTDDSFGNLPKQP